jgi:hypothetical protein
MTQTDDFETRKMTQTDDFKTSNMTQIDDFETPDMTQTGNFVESFALHIHHDTIDSARVPGDVLKLVAGSSHSSHRRPLRRTESRHRTETRLQAA